MSRSLQSGPQLFRRLGVTRWYLLKEHTTQQTWTKRVEMLKARGQPESAAGPCPSPGIPDPTCLLHLYNKKESQLRWAPRDALNPPCATLSEWRAHGFAEYQMLLSLMGSDDKATRDSNRFVNGGYTYVHLSFDKFVQVLGQLRLEDRFFCYVIPEDVPVHVYFDLDGDLTKFPSLAGRDEECLNAILAAVRAVFAEVFHRPMDTSKFILLDATSPVKLSWHVHIQSEAFRSVQHLKAFVVRVNRRLSEDPNVLLPIDPAPYSKNQNFRAPHCLKPGVGKLPLLPRSFCAHTFATHGTIVLDPARPCVLGGAIDQELLWRCHPALAQPGAAYTYLEMEEAKSRKRGRAALGATADDDNEEEEALTTENRARKLVRLLAPGAARSTSSSVACAMTRAISNALPGSVRTLTTEEQVALISLLCQYLGPCVQLSEAAWYQHAYGMHAPIIVGICASGSAWCITKTQYNRAPHTHGTNRMQFKMESSGYIDLRCFCNKISHRLPFDAQSQEVQDKLLTPPSNSFMEQPAAVVSAPRPEPEPIVALIAPPRAPDLAPPPQPPPSAEERQRALVAFVRQALVEQYPLPVAVERWQQHEKADDRLIRSVFRVAGGAFANVDVDALLRQYRQRCDERRRPPEWGHIKTIDERYLDLSRAELLPFFLQSPFVAVQSGQGTNKTGVVLVLLLILLIRNPDLRVLMLSNRITFADTLSERAKEFDDEVASHFDKALGFRSYTEKTFARPPQQAGQELSPAQANAKSKADRALVHTPRLILSPQSLARLFSAHEVSGQPIVPRYDVIIGDEFMEILHIFHTATMDGKRRVVLEQLTMLMSQSQRIIVMDADLADGMALPMLNRLTKGAPFCKLLNIAKTMPRTYWNYPLLGLWRQKLLAELTAGHKVFVACNSKKQVESIIHDPQIKALGLRIKGLHGSSCADDRANYTCTVRKWDELDCLVISPVVSHGVNFDKKHFDCLFMFGTPRSTMPTQLFQQLNRVRDITSNEVHMFLKSDPNLNKHLPSTYDAVKSELTQLLLGYERDYLVMDVLTARPVAAARAGRSQSQYNIDISPWGEVRRVLNTLGNELYCHNQSRINAGRLQFEAAVHRLIQETGGEICQVIAPSFEAKVDAVMLGASISEMDQERERTKLQAVVDALDIDEERYAALKQRQRYHELDDDESDLITKTEWKFIYGIPLSDTRRMRDVEDFATRFGADQCLQRAKALTTVLLVPMASLRPVLAPQTDPIPYQCADLQLRQYTLLLLTAIGLEPPPDDDDATPGSVLRATSIVNSWDQALALEPTTQLRNTIVQQLENAPARFQAAWKTHKSTHRWTVENEVLFQPVRRPVPHDGGSAVREPVSGQTLHKALLAQCRAHLNSYYGVAIRSKRMGRANARRTQYQLDRTYWNEWSTALFRLEPQVFPSDWPKAQSKAKVTVAAPPEPSNGKETCDSVDAELVVLQPPQGECGPRYQSVSGKKNQCWWRCASLALGQSQEQLQSMMVATLQAISSAEELLDLGVIETTVGADVSASKRNFLHSTRFVRREWGGDAEMRLLSLALGGHVCFAVYEQGVEEVQYYPSPEALIPPINGSMYEVALHYCNINGHADRRNNHYNLIGHHMPDGAVWYKCPLDMTQSEEVQETTRQLCSDAVVATAQAVQAQLKQQEQATADFIKQDHAQG